MCQTSVQFELKHWSSSSRDWSGAVYTVLGHWNCSLVVATDSGLFSHFLGGLAATGSEKLNACRGTLDHSSRDGRNREES